jgi:polysaccharide pyruvyl transferase WcaK-like protein
MSDQYKSGIIAASSRFNFGDVLYSKLAEYMFSDFIHVNLNGCNVDNFTNITLPFNKVSLDKAMYIGGELYPKSISSQWLSEDRYRAFFYRVAEKLNLAIAPGLFVAARREMSLSVGMQNIDMASRDTVSRLSKFEFLGVRDDISYKKAKLRGLDPTLIPDIALLSSEYMSCKLEKTNTAVFHFNEAFLKYNFNDALEIVNYYSNNFGLNPIIQNMAKCKNHDSEHLARLLANRVKGQFLDADSVVDIVRTLERCNLYVGNSFHGGIVASSFKSPIVWVEAHGNKLKNLSNFYSIPYINTGSKNYPDPHVINESFSRDAVTGLEYAKSFFSS